MEQQVGQPSTLGDVEPARKRQLERKLGSGSWGCVACRRQSVLVSPTGAGQGAITGVSVCLWGKEPSCLVAASQSRRGGAATNEGGGGAPRPAAGPQPATARPQTGGAGGALPGGSTALRCPAGAPLAKGLRRQGAEGPPAPRLSCCCCCAAAAVAGPLWLLRQLSCQQRICEPQQLLLEPLHVCACRGQGRRKQAT